MTKLFVDCVTGPFWVWMFILIAAGMAGAFTGAFAAWLKAPRYIVVSGYSVSRPVFYQAVKVPSIASAIPARRPSLLQRLIEFRKGLQPVIEVVAVDDWQETARFRRVWHHKRYRSYLKREYGVTIPKGKVIVYSRWGEYAVKYKNTYYVIPWK